MVPAAFVGLFLEEVITALFDQNIVWSGPCFLTGGLLFLADRAKASEKDIDAKSALGIGLMQAVAILPWHLAQWSHHSHCCLIGH